ncbi:MAG: acetoacetate decarboxylase family protein [Promethearchaeia archaeon]
MSNGSCPPLPVVSLPVALAFIVDYPSTNQGLPYHEGTLMIRCQYDGVPGNYYCYARN